MIKIKKPWIENISGKSRCYCDVYIDDLKRGIWFEVDEQYGKYLCTERSDAYVIGLLNLAMRENHDIECEVPVTEELLYNINVILIPSLFKYSKSLHKISVIAEPALAIDDGVAVGTGCSCGVDSFSAIYNHTRKEYNSLDLTHLCINNVGAFNSCYSEYGEEKVKKERYQKTDEVAKAIGLPLIKTDSNFAQIVHQEHLLTHTYSSIFAVYMLQKLWKVYYYASSGYDYSKFSIIDNDIYSCGYYELLSLQCFSISSLRIYSEGGEKTRLEKTQDISEFLPAQKYLHVCLSKPYNCGLCAKCRRTLVTLDYLGKLDDFSKVFDIERYKENRKDYYIWLYKQHCQHDEMNEPVYQGMKKRTSFKKAIRKERVLWPLKKAVKRVLRILKRSKNWVR